MKKVWYGTIRYSGSIRRRDFMEISRMELDELTPKLQSFLYDQGYTLDGKLELHD